MATDFLAMFLTWYRLDPKCKEGFGVSELASMSCLVLLTSHREHGSLKKLEVFCSFFCSRADILSLLE